MKRLSLSGLILLAMVSSLLGLGLQPANAADVISLSSQSRSFSPNGDNVEDSLDVSFYIYERASLDVVVKDSSGSAIRQLAQGESYGYGYYNVAWNGRNEDGDVVPDGKYSVDIVATGGNATVTLSLATEVDTVRPATWVSPAPRDRLSGSVPLAIRPSMGRTLSGASFWSDGCSWRVTQPDPTGSMTVDADVTACRAGSRRLKAQVDYNDSFGQTHNYSLPELPVTFVDDDAPSATFTSLDVKVLALEAPNQLRSFDWSLSCTDSSKVTLTSRIVDSAGDPVRSTPMSSVGYCDDYYSSYRLRGSWDGRDEEGLVVPDGDYELVATLVDDLGHATTVRRPLSVDTTMPARITAPAADAVLQGTTTLRVTPEPTVNVTGVSFFLRGCSFYQNTPDPDGSFAVAADLNQCTAGSGSVEAQVTWADRFGGSHTTSTAERPVFVADEQAPSVSLQSNAQIYLSRTSPSSWTPAKPSYWCRDDGLVTRTWSLEDGVGKTVRRYPQGPAAFCGSFDGPELNGLADDGSALPSGTYTLVGTATDAAGHTTALPQVSVNVDSRTPATWTTQPTAGTKLLSPFTVSLSPEATTTIDSVSFSLDGCSEWRGKLDSDVYSTSIDPSMCSPGDSKLRASVTWSDSEGAHHRYTLATTPVEIADTHPPRANLLTDTDLTLWRTRPQETTTGIVKLSCEDDGKASWNLVVKDASGTVVRSYPSPVSTRCATPQSPEQVTIDGLDDAGQVLAPGQYTFVATITDRGGNADSVRVMLTLNTASPGELITPVEGNPLSVGEAFTTRFRVADGVTPYDSVYSLGGCQWGWLQRDTDSSDWVATVIPSNSCGGARDLQVELRYLRADGQYSTYTTTRRVDIAPAAPALSYWPYSSYRASVLTSPGEVQKIQTTFTCTGSAAASWTAEVLDSTGNVVRTMPARTEVGCAQVQAFVFDAKDSTGAQVADGDYTVKVAVTDEQGRSDSMSVPVLVRLEEPAAWITPNEGEALATTTLAVRPTVALSSASFSYGECSWTGINDPETGYWSVQAMVSFCNINGTYPAGYSAAVTWYDAFGDRHSYSLAPRLPGTSTPEPDLNLIEANAFVGVREADTVSPATVRVTCASTDSTSTLAWTLADKAGDIVATDSSAAKAQCRRSSQPSILTIDPIVDGHRVPDGTYTLRVTVTDATGTGQREIPLTVNTTVPAEWTIPPSDFVVTGELTPSLRVASALVDQVSSVSFSAPGLFEGQTAAPDGAGTFTTSASSTSWPSGPTTLTATINWRSGSGRPTYVMSRVIRVDGTSPSLTLYPQSRPIVLTSPSKTSSLEVAYSCRGASDVRREVTLTDDLGKVVRHYPSAEATGCANGSLSIDGSGDDSRPLASGVYTLRVSIADAFGRKATDTTAITINAMVPAEWTAPVEGEQQTGSVTATVSVPETTTGVRLASGSMWLSSCYAYASVTPTTLTGTFWSGCPSGTMTARVDWYDDSGHYNSYELPPRTVDTGESAPALSYPSGGIDLRAATPTSLETKTIRFECRGALRVYVQTTLLRPDGSVVREDAPAPGQSCGGTSTSSIYVTAAATQSDGASVKDGDYVLRTTVTNGLGARDSVDLPVHVDTTSPVASIAPGSGKVGGPTGFVITARAGIEFSWARVSVADCGQWGDYADAEGSSVTVSTSLQRCRTGTSSFEFTVDWSDTNNQSHSFTQSADYTITAAPPTLSRATSERVVVRPDTVDTYGVEVVPFACTVFGTPRWEGVLKDANGVSVSSVVTPTRSDACSYYGWAEFRVTGLDRSGARLASGAYTLVATITDSRGASTTVDVPIRIDSRPPASWVTPEVDGTVGPSVEAGVKVATGIQAPSVTFTLAGCAWSTSALAMDRTLRSTSDLSSCRKGQHPLGGTLSWTENGRSHSYTLEPRPVKLAGTGLPWIKWYSVPQLTLADPSKIDATYANFQCFAASVGTVDAYIEDASGTVVRTLPMGSTNCSYYYNSVWLDGRDDDGNILDDGTFKLVVKLTDGDGQSITDSRPLVVDSRQPARWSRIPGPTLNGDFTMSVAPAAGANLTQVRFSTPSCSWYGTADQDGGFTATGNTSSCSYGAAKLNAVVSWQDESGRSFSYTLKPVDVVVLDQAPPTITAPDPLPLLTRTGPNTMAAQTARFRCSDSSPVSWSFTMENESGEVVQSGSRMAQTCSNWYYDADFTVTGRAADDSILPAGTYTITATATDAGGLTSTAKTQVRIDPRIPAALKAPTTGSTLAGRPSFEVIPSSGTTLRRVDFYLAGRSFAAYAASSDGSWRTTQQVGGLPAGATSLGWTARWVDDAGAEHSYNDSIPVKIDPVAVAVSADMSPVSGVAPFDSTLVAHVSDPKGEVVTLGIDWGDGSAKVTQQVPSPYADITMRHTFVEPGSYRVVVTGRNSSGTVTAKTLEINATLPPNEPPTLSASITPATLAPGEQVAVTLDANDPESQQMTYNVDYGDGSAPATGTYPATSLTHSYARPGTYLVRVRVSDGKQTAYRTQRVTVAVNEPLVAVAGDDRQVLVGDEVAFDASGSRPSAFIDRYVWSFGDGTSAVGADATHKWAEPGTYTVNLTTTMGTAHHSDTVVVTVQPVPKEPGLAVTVNGRGGGAVSNAELVVVRADGTRLSAATGAEGRASLQGLADGEYTIFAVKSGFRPGKATAVMKSGSGEATITLEPGEVATAEVTSTPMTPEQITAAGIDVNDPANQHVVEFQVHLAFIPDSPVTGYANGGGLATCPEIAGVEVVCWPVGGGGGGGGGGGAGADWCTSHCYGASFETKGYRVEVTAVGDQLLWLVIPGRAKWLKEFFDVQLMVTNLSDGEEFAFTDGAASLDVPKGMVLAPTARPQSATMSFPDVPAGESRTVDWFLRGDEEGFYKIAASYSGLLQPFGNPITLRAEAKDPLHVWGGSAFKLVVDADDRVDSSYPYHVTVGVENVADVPMYNVSLELLKAGKLNYIYQPREQLEVTRASLAPGETLQRDWILVPKISGTLSLADSFVSYSSGLKFASAELRSHPQVNPVSAAPQLDVVSLNKKVGLIFEPVPGATSYAIYSTSADDVDFVDAPDPDSHVVAPTSDGRIRAWLGGVTPGPSRQYAVSPLVDGEPLMSHPMRPARSLSSSFATSSSIRVDTASGDGHTCGVSGPFQASITYADPFGLGTYEYEITDASGTRTVGPIALPGGPFEERVEIPVDLTGVATAKIRARATNIAGDVGEWETLDLDKKCGYKRVVVLAAGLQSSLDRDQATTVQLDPRGCPGFDDARDAVNNTWASNACKEKYFGSPKEPWGNLVAYLKAKGFDPGTSRSSEGRTLLEFSYEGATTPSPEICGPRPDQAKPALWPKNYSSWTTFQSIIGELNFPQSTGRAQNYFNELVRYDQCWRRAYGQALDFTFVGHSLGGYQSLAMARIAAAAERDGKPTIRVSGLLTVDGAIHPSTVYRLVGAGKCAVPDGWLAGLGDVATEAAKRALLAQPTFWNGVNSLLAEKQAVSEQIKLVQGRISKPTYVATVTNSADGCLLEEATTNPQADIDTVFTVDHKDWVGMDGHGALLKSHTTPVGSPGYPLISVLDSVLSKGAKPTDTFFPSASEIAAQGSATTQRSSSSASQLKYVTARTAASLVAPSEGTSSEATSVQQPGIDSTGSVEGVTVSSTSLSGTLEAGPSALGQVVLVGDDFQRYTSTDADGSFAFSDVPVGDYRLWVQPIARGWSGHWVGGGSDISTAQVFQVSDAALDVGAVAGVAPASVAVHVSSSEGSKVVADAPAALIDAAGSAVAVARTDVRGDVNLSAPPGSYTLMVGTETLKAISRQITLPATSSVSVDLSPGATIQLTMLDEQGLPLVNKVAALYDGDKLLGATMTNPAGRATFVVDGGNYSVRLLDPSKTVTFPSESLPVTAVVGDPSAAEVVYKLGDSWPTTGPTPTSGPSTGPTSGPSTGPTSVPSGDPSIDQSTGGSSSPTAMPTAGSSGLPTAPVGPTTAPVEPTAAPSSGPAGGQETTPTTVPTQSTPKPTATTSPPELRPKVTAKAVKRASRLLINVDPDRRGQYLVVILKKVGHRWVKTTKVKTTGAKSTRIIDLSKGVYKVRVKVGGRNLTSKPVRLVR